MGEGSYEDKYLRRHSWRVVSGCRHTPMGFHHHLLHSIVGTAGHHVVNSHTLAGEEGQLWS